MENRHVPTEALGTWLLLPRERQGLARWMFGPGRVDPAWPPVAGTLGDGDALSVPWDAWMIDGENGENGGVFGVVRGG